MGHLTFDAKSNIARLETNFSWHSKDNPSGSDSRILSRHLSSEKWEKKLFRKLYKTRLFSGDIRGVVISTHACPRPGGHLYSRSSYKACKRRTTPGQDVCQTLQPARCSQFDACIPSPWPSLPCACPSCLKTLASGTLPCPQVSCSCTAFGSGEEPSKREREVIRYFVGLFLSWAG